MLFKPILYIYRYIRKTIVIVVVITFLLIFFVAITPGGDKFLEFPNRRLSAIKLYR